MEIFGYIASLFIGISLGLIGGGGSILTVPVLVYLFGVQPFLAASYSLFIVGVTSTVGALSSARKGLLSIRAALLFGASSVITVFLVRKLAVPAIPETITTINGTAITSGMLMMLLFAVLMLFASLSMIRGRRNLKEEPRTKHALPVGKLVPYGIAIGIVTGLLGAGGGFLLIPALVLLLHLPMKTAIGTSLMIIAMNAVIGFLGDLGHFSIDWFFLLKITAIAVAGIFIGQALGKNIAGGNLRKGFGWFVLVMGVYIIVKEMVL